MTFINGLFFALQIQMLVEVTLQCICNVNMEIQLQFNLTQVC